MKGTLGDNYKTIVNDLGVNFNVVRVSADLRAAVTVKKLPKPVMGVRKYIQIWTRNARCDRFTLHLNIPMKHFETIMLETL